MGSRLGDWVKKNSHVLLSVLVILVASAGVLWSQQQLWQSQVVPIWTDTKLESRPNEYPVYKVYQRARKEGVDLVLDIDVRGKFTTTGSDISDMEEEIKDSTRTTSASKLMESIRHDLRKSLSSVHDSILASRMLRQDENAWRLSEPISTSDFEQMSHKELDNFKDQILKTIFISLKVRTLNDAKCQADESLLIRKTSLQDNPLKHYLSKPIPTVNDTYLLFNESFRVTKSKPHSCRDLQQWSRVSQILRPSFLEDKGPSWFKSFRAVDESFFPENRCQLYNKLITDYYATYPRTILSILFCY